MRRLLALLCALYAGQAFAVNVTACEASPGSIITTGSTTYQLQNDITSTGTCLTIGSGKTNVTIDLNGHRLTFGTGNGIPSHGIHIDATGFLVTDTSVGGGGEVFQGATVDFSITDANTVTRQIGIVLTTGGGVIEKTKVTMNKTDSRGIQWGGGSTTCGHSGQVEIRNNTITQNATDVSVRDYFNGQSLVFVAPDDKFWVHDNTFVNNPQGFVWFHDGHCGDTPARVGCEDGSRINNNHFTNNNNVAQNGSAIFFSEGIGVEIDHNVVDGTHTEGLQIDHPGACKTLGVRTMIHDETYTTGTGNQYRRCTSLPTTRCGRGCTNVGATCTEAGAGDHQGVRIRYEGSSVDFYSNTVSCTSSATADIEQSNSVCFWFTCQDSGGAPGGSFCDDYDIHNNTFTSRKTGPSTGYNACCDNEVVELSGIVTPTLAVPIKFYNNTLKGNSVLWMNGRSNASTLHYPDTFYQNNNLQKYSADATFVDFFTFDNHSYGSQTGTDTEDYLDFLYSGGAAESNHENSGSTNDNSDTYRFSQDIQVQDKCSNPVAGAVVNCLQHASPFANTGSCTTNVNGFCTAYCKEATYFITATDLNFNPEDITTTVGGDTSTLSSVTVGPTSHQTRVLTLANTPAGSCISNTNPGPVDLWSLRRTDVETRHGSTP